MSVTGTQQRVYGTLIYDNCHIDLRRFAIVFGSTTKSPRKSSNVLYGNEVPMIQTGYKYSGYITLFMYQDTGDVYAAIEVRVCKRDKKTILIDTYGEIALPNYDIILWFDKNNTKYFASQYDFPQFGSETTTYIDLSTNNSYVWHGAGYTEGDGWVELGSETVGNILSHNTQTITKFEEKGSKNSLSLINCCKYCPDICEEYCDIFTSIHSYKLKTRVIGYEKVKLDIGFEYYHDVNRKIIPYGIKNLGYKTILIQPQNLCIEYKFKMEDGNTYFMFWIYPSSNTSRLEYGTICIKAILYPYASYGFCATGFISDFYDDETKEIPLHNNFSYILPTHTDYNNLVGKIIKTDAMSVTQYANIISIDDTDNIAIIDPNTIFSSSGSNQIRPIIDGNFTLTGTVIYEHFSMYHITYFKILEIDVNLEDLYIDLNMTVTFNNVVTLRSMYLGNEYYINHGTNYGDYMVQFTNIIHNPDNTYTAIWNGKLNGSFGLTLYPNTNLYIYIDTNVYCEGTTISGNVAWSSASSGRELHYGDKCLVVNGIYNDGFEAVIIS